MTDRFAFAYRADLRFADWVIHRSRHADVADALVAGMIWRARMAQHRFSVSIQIGEIVGAGRDRVFRPVQRRPESEAA